MVFSSAIFVFVFLPIVFFLNCIVPEKYSNVLLLTASLVFYAWGEPVMVLLMLFSIVLNWFTGLMISRTEGNGRKLFLIFGVACDLMILGYYKYIGMIADVINSVAGAKVFNAPEVALPIGISFFTFQAISYVADVYRRNTEPSKNLVNVALYISFFPQLIAGPIVKYRDINRQIESRHTDAEGVSQGFRRFIYGLSKKVLIANTLGACADAVYAMNTSDVDCRAAWIAAMAYTFQIYYDFSGYSDMAIGLGRMFGFSIPENFNYPYTSGSISEFWRRWHISLGTWFREYLYIPLGGNRRGTTRTYLNLFIVFMLTGLWHGADFAFVIWGLYHGIFCIIERMGFGKLLEKSKLLSRCYAFMVVSFGWILFRTESTKTTARLIARMLLPWRHRGPDIPVWEYIDPKTVFIGICAVLGAGLIQRLLPEDIKARWKGSVIEALYCAVLLVISIAYITGSTYNPFIYFQF